VAGNALTQSGYCSAQRTQGRLIGLRNNFQIMGESSEVHDRLHLAETALPIMDLLSTAL
jgi:hypothetical protein